MKRIVPGKAYTAPLASPHLLEYSWEDVEKDHSLNPLSESDAAFSRNPRRLLSNCPKLLIAALMGGGGSSKKS